MATNKELDEQLKAREYSAGFVTDIDADTLPPGLNEDVIRMISAKKSEPAWLLNWRLEAFRHWQTMNEPKWANVHHEPIDYQAISYYSAPKAADSGPESLDEVDPKLLETYAKLGIPLREQEFLAGVQNVAVDAGFDSGVRPWTKRRFESEKQDFLISRTELEIENGLKKYVNRACIMNPDTTKNDLRNFVKDYINHINKILNDAMFGLEKDKRSEENKLAKSIY